MNSIFVIATNTFREIIRDRILYGLMVFALLLIGLSLILGELSYAEQSRISADFGFLAINISSVIIAIFIGSTLVSREIEQRTVYTLLAHPVTREQFLLGKVLGLFLVNILVAISLSLLLSIVFYFLKNPWSMECTLTVFGIMLESLVMLAVTVLFGTITRPMLVVSYSIGIFIIGRSVDSLKFFAEKSTDPGFKMISAVLQKSFPNLSKFNWSNYVLVSDQIPYSMIMWSTVYALSWVAICVFLSALIFRKKDFV
jgi:ABC-type transport system involved in multi-copper enzyme maturation permease subunit